MLKLTYMLEFVFNFNRWSVVGQSYSSDILCDLISLISSKVRSNSNGCIPNLPPGLDDIIPSCRWSGCGNTGTSTFLFLLLRCKIYTNLETLHIVKFFENAICFLNISKKNWKMSKYCFLCFHNSMSFGPPA
jgi:hypothetical protein